MSIKKNSEISNKLAEVIVFGMQEKKAYEIVKLDLRDIHATLSDYFVICHAESHTQLKAIAKSVEEEVFKSFGHEVWNKEGQENGEWILLDYVDVVVHIFKSEKRDHYRIEDLWGDAKKESYQSA